MGPLKPSPEILALAQALVEQLGVDDRRDLLSRWMAHDLAAKMIAAEAPDASADVEAACAEAVKALWARRAEFPDGKRPFEDLEGLADVVRRLDPERSQPAYFRRTEASEGQSDPWLAAAEHFDRGARVLVLTCLKEAAVRSGRKAGEWAHLAESAGLDAREIAFVRIIMGEAAEPDAAKLREAERLKGLLETLAAFRKTAAAAAKEFRAQLAALEPLPRQRSTPAVRLNRGPRSPRR